MNSDIRISTSLLSNLKVRRLKSNLGSRGFESLISMWIYVGLHCPDGFLTGMDGVDIEAAANWQGKKGAFFEAITDEKSRFIDWIDGTYVVHDWEEHNSYASKAKARTSKAKRANKARRDKKEALLKTESSDAKNESEDCPLPVPSPVPVPSPNPSPTPAQRENEGRDSKLSGQTVFDDPEKPCDLTGGFIGKAIEDGTPVQPKKVERGGKGAENHRIRVEIWDCLVFNWKQEGGYLGSKGKAREIFMREKKTPQDANLVLVAAEEYLSSKYFTSRINIESQKQYIPTLQSWLENKRWTQDPAEWDNAYKPNGQRVERDDSATDYSGL